MPSNDLPNARESKKKRVLTRHKPLLTNLVSLSFVHSFDTERSKINRMVTVYIFNKCKLLKPFVISSSHLEQNQLKMDLFCFVYFFFPLNI